MSTPLAQVVDAIERTSEELVSFLAEYVRFRSINIEMAALEGRDTQLAECQAWLRDVLRSWSAFDEVEFVARDARQPTIVARRSGSGGGRSLLFNGHSDVVPVTTDQMDAWTRGGPWNAVVADGKVWGRGTADMKGGNAAFLWAVKVLADEGVELKGDLFATVVASEETCDHAFGVDLLAPAGYIADFAIVAEGTDLVPCPATVGEFYFRVRVVGESAHISSRHRSIYPTDAPHGDVPGVNAIDKMWKIQRALMDLEREWGLWQRHSLMPAGAMNINFARILGGDTISAMASSCEIAGSVLFNPDLDFECVQREFVETIESVCHTDYWLREHPPEITVPYVFDHKEPVNVSVAHPGTEALARAYERTFGSRPAVAGSTSTNDGAYLGAAGHTVVTCGPGTLDAGAHGVDEHIEVNALLDAVKLYTAMALEWCEAVA